MHNHPMHEYLDHKPLPKRVIISVTNNHRFNFTISMNIRLTKQCKEGSPYTDSTRPHQHKTRVMNVTPTLYIPD